MAPSARLRAALAAIDEANAADPTIVTVRDRTGPKEIVHAVTSMGEDRAGPAALARIARGQWGIESVHWVRDTAYREDSGTGYRGSGPQVMATCR